MPQYRFGYWEEQGGFIYFEAKDIDEARRLYEQMENGEILEDDLPDYYKNYKNGQTEYEKLEEVK
jgi:uncharacterized membrane protein